MTTYYKQGYKVLVATDCLVFGYDLKEEQLKLLLFKRKVEPFIDNWSLVGSFINEGENMRDTANRVLKDFTGLDNVFLKQLKSYGEADRDPGGRVISVGYWSLITLKQQNSEVVQSHGAEWFGIHDLPEMIMDHGQMVSDALQNIRDLAKHFPIGKELLPELFTIPQLLSLYRSIYQQDIDDRNFRKKILSSKLLIKQDKKDKSSSKKGAFFYTFDEEKYEQLLETGYHFGL